MAQMSKELETSECPAVKNNVIVVLCDLAVRYSARIDPYIPVVSSCMKDPSLMVRKQSLTLLTHLLQEDYVKWKGSLFFRFITTLLDGQLKKFGECGCVCVCQTECTVFDLPKSSHPPRVRIVLATDFMEVGSKYRWWCKCMQGRVA